MGHDAERYDIFRAALPDEIKSRVEKMSKDMGISQRKIYEQALQDFEKFRANQKCNYKDYETEQGTSSIRLQIGIKKRLLARAKKDDVTARKVMCSAIERFYNKVYY